MTAYVEVILLLNFVIDGLLLLAANRLCGHVPKLGRTAFAASVGSLYALVCLLPGFAFLGNVLWRTVFLMGIAFIGFGISVSGLRRGVVFVLMSMSLGGIMALSDRRNFGSLITATIGLGFMCWLGFRNGVGLRKFVPVELHVGDELLCLTALLDTGNALKDPITGAPVLVVGADVAEKLTGLTSLQLNNPVETMGAVPGLRLIPYHSVGNAGGMLLAMRVSKVKIGTWQGSTLVALAPCGLSMDGEYQALTGGIA